MRYQIHCLISKNDAIIIVIEDDCHATMFQCRSAQERFAHVNHVKCDLDQDLFSTVRDHVPVQQTLFVRSVAVLRVFAATASTFVELTIGNCGSEPGWADMSKTSRIDHQLVLLSFPIRLIFPNSQCTDVSCCLPAKISRVPHLRIQSCSLEINFVAVLTCLVSKFHRLVYCCHFH